MTPHSTRERRPDRVAHGDHLCLAFTDDAEQRRVVTTYLLGGLARGERVMYFADRSTPGQILSWLRSTGADPAAAQASGQLTVTTADDSYLADGPFDADAMVAGLHREVDDALAAGFTGFRVSGEMGWALRDVPGAERLGEYETKVNEVFAGHPASAICQYDLRRFEAADLDRFDRCHNGTVEQQALYAGPELRLVPFLRDGRQSLRVVGDVDYESAGALATGLEATADWPGDLTVDMSAVRFIDLAGMRALTRVAERLPAGRFLHVIGLDPMLGDVIQVIGWDRIPSLTISTREVPA